MQVSIIRECSLLRLVQDTYQCAVACTAIRVVLVDVLLTGACMRQSQGALILLCNGRFRPIELIQVSFCVNALTRQQASVLKSLPDIWAHPLLMTMTIRTRQTVDGGQKVEVLGSAFV